MSWLLWRQHRLQLWIGAAVLAAFAVAVVATGVHMAHVYDDWVAQCAGNRACSLVGNLFSGYGAIVDTVHLTVILPVVFGVVGATLVSRETDHATNLLAWTQSVTRRRWTLTKFAAALAVTVVTSAAVAALVTWWSNTPNAYYGNRFQGAQFDTQNIVPVAFAVFALALGLAFGSLLRRPLPALGLTVLTYLAVRVVVAIYVRPHYAAPVKRIVALGTSAVPPGSWTVKQSLLDPARRTIGEGRMPVPGACRNVDGRGIERCLGHLGYRTLVEFHPASSYWHFQWAEASLFLGLAVVLFAVAVRLTLRRDA